MEENTDVKQKRDSTESEVSIYEFEFVNVNTVLKHSSVLFITLLHILSNFAVF